MTTGPRTASTSDLEQVMEQMDAQYLAKRRVADAAFEVERPHPPVPNSKPSQQASLRAENMRRVVRAGQYGRR